MEILRINQLSTQRQSLLVITALDASSSYSPLVASEACRMLANTPWQCVENCDILKLVGLPCGRGGLNKNIAPPSKGESTGGLGSGGVAGIAVVVIVLLIAALFGGIYYYRRKYKKAKVNMLFTFDFFDSPILFFVICCGVAKDPTGLSIGTFSKPRRQRQRERGKTKGLMSRTMALHCIIKLCIFLNRPLQNNNVKSLHSAYSRQRESRRQIVHVSI